MFKKLLKKMLTPIILEILKENGIEFKPSPTVFKGYDSNKHFYIKHYDGWLNIITNRVITNDEYERLKGK